MHSNEVGGSVFGHLVQARDIHGDVHLHQGPVSVARQRLQRALREATVAVGSGQGVAVAPGTVLTCGEDGLVFVRQETQGLACLSAEYVNGDELVCLGTEPGSPVLNWRTGGVCALIGSDGKPVGVPESAVGREHRDWLDLLDADQLRAGGWRHIGPALRGYLDAVRKADRDHPYPSVRHAAPPLSKIYLTRQATRQADDTEPESLDRVDADSLLERHPGVQVLGYPGAGKSSLVRHIAATTAARWLDSHEGAFVPVPITADVLSQDRTLPDALADGVIRGLSHGLDRAALLELFRAEPMPGVPWLVLVDGLDEVLEPAARHTVLRKVADHRENPAYRFLITSRPLDDRGFAGLIDRAQFPTYVIEPFSDDELSTFVVGWLGARELAEPERAAAEFVARVRRTKLYELAHVPLISTMLCLLFAEKPDAELPDNQSQLYREFVSWLVVKLREADVRVQLRRRVAPYGPTAEAAADALLERIQNLFQDIAYDHQLLGTGRRELSLFERAVAWRGVEPPGAVPESEWAEVIADALRISGLLVQRRDDWRFLHQTVEEYFAACHLATEHPDPRAWSSRKLLAPQREWPWPHLEVMIFLVARWAESGQDLSRKLGRLLGWRHREHNIGFIAELVRHGVTVEPKVLRRATALLVKAVSTSDTPSKQWHDSVGWLRDIAPELVSGEVERLAFGNAPEHRRFEAIRHLLSTDPNHGVVVTRRFIEDPKTGRMARLSLGKQLLGMDFLLGVNLLDAVGKENLDDEIRMQVAELLLEARLDVGLSHLAALAGDSSAGSRTRLEAARIHLSLTHNQEQGFRVMSGLLSSVRNSVVWTTAAVNLLIRDRDRTVALLSEIAGDGARETDFRFWAAEFLVVQAGESPSPLVGLASDKQFDRKLRVKAALTRGVDQKSAAKILADVARGCPPHDPYLFTVREHLLKVDAKAAITELTVLAENRDGLDKDRMRAIKLIGPHVSTARLTQLYENLGGSASSTAERLAAIKAAVDLGSTNASQLLDHIIGNSSMAGEKRLDAALMLRRLDSRDGDKALEALARDSRTRDHIRLDAALALRKSRRGRGEAVLKEIARDTGISGPVRKKAQRAIE